MLLWRNDINFTLKYIKEFK